MYCNQRVKYTKCSFRYCFSKFDLLLNDLSKYKRLNKLSGQLEKNKENISLDGVCPI